MSASPVSSPHVVPQSTATNPTRNQAPNAAAKSGGTESAGGTSWNWARDARPTQSSYKAPGTGLVVDRHA